MRIGILGGSFDPVHYGHLLLAETCRETCRLDEIRFVPAAIPPHKQDRQRAPARQRIEMLRRAIAGHRPFSVSTVEVDRGGVSYTVDTLRALRRSHPQAELFLLLGADAIQDLPTWWEPAEICRLATVVAVARPPGPPPDLRVLAAVAGAERLELFRRYQVRMPLIELSSSDIRRRVQTGRSVRFRTPRAVEDFIRQQGLYRASLPRESGPSGSR
jgi:nicotinate-nucleotide adenylyltransferase